MRLTTLVAVILSCAFVVGAQDYDYYDYSADTTNIQNDPAAGTGIEDLADVRTDPPVETETTSTTTTTTITTTTEAPKSRRRKLISFKHSRRNRTRTFRQRPTSSTEQPIVERDDVADSTQLEATPSRRGETLRSRNTRLRGRQSTSSKSAISGAEREIATVAPRARGRFRSPSSKIAPKETASPSRVSPSSRRFSPTPSEAKEETRASTSSSRRFSPRRNFRHSSTDATTPASTDETTDNHRFSGVSGRRGNIRRFQSNSQNSHSEGEDEAKTAEDTTPASRSRLPNRRLSSRKFQGKVTRRPQRVLRPKVPKTTTSAPTTTTTTTTTTPATTSTTTTTSITTTTTTEAPMTEEPVLLTTESIVIPEEVPVKQMEPMIKMEDIPAEEMTSQVQVMNKDELMTTGTDEVMMMEDEIMNEDEIDMESMARSIDMAHVDEMIIVDRVMSKDGKETTVTNFREIPVDEREKELAGVVLRPLPVRPTTETPTTTTTTTTTPATTTTAATRAPRTRSSRRKSSRYTPPKPPSHPIVETTQAPSPDIFAPPLSESVRSNVRENTRYRVSTPATRETSPKDVTNSPVTIAPKAVETKPEENSRFRRPNYGRPDIQFVGSAVKITEIGTVEDTPPNEVRMILAGLGSRRRGLARPQVASSAVRPTQAPKPKQVQEPVFDDTPAEDYYYDYYYDY